MAFEPGNFLHLLAPQILAELKPPAELKRFTTNPALVGGYVEAGVRQLVRRYLAPVRVCTGAVIDQAQSPASKNLPQLDTIAWIPSPVPAVFEVGEFALVPRSSSMGMLEIKSSAYDPDRLALQLDPEVIRSVTADPHPHEGVPADVLFGLGVICVLLPGQDGPQLRELRESGRVVALFEERDGAYLPNAEGVFRMLNFLAGLRRRAAVHDGQLHVNLDLVRSEPPG